MPAPDPIPQFSEFDRPSPLQVNEGPPPPPADFRWKRVEEFFASRELSANTQRKKPPFRKQV